MVKGDAAQAQLHYQRAMAIFELVYEDEPELLEQKRQELECVSSQFGKITMKLLV